MGRGIGAALAAVVVSTSLLAGCGGQSGVAAGSGDDDPAALTARAVAAVALDHLPGGTSSRTATYVDEDSPPALVGADLRYGAGPEDDGDLVRVTVDEGRAVRCGSGATYDGCVELDADTILAWDLLAPEEDPGLVLVQHLGGDGRVSVLSAGPEITADPRKLDLSASVESLAELARDPRLRITTTAGVVAAGEALSPWGGGERGAGELDEVPNNDRTLAMAWLSAYGDGLRYVGASPVKDVLGSDALGGRVRVSGEFMPVGPGTVDVLAAPAAPEWLVAGDCLDGYRCARVAGTSFAWRPASGADPGDAYVLVVRESGETVGFHAVGRRLSGRARAAAGSAGVYMWGPDLVDPEYSPGAPSLTTTRERFEQFDR